MPVEEKLILLVEDSEEDAFFFKRALQRAELKNPVHVVGDADQGIAYLAGAGEFSDRSKFRLPSVVIVDLRLPGKDGFQVVEWIAKRPELRTVLVVVLTGGGRLADASKAYRLGANSFLAKPVRPEDLQNLARGFAAYWGN